MVRLIWSMTRLKKVLLERQNNEFDCNIAVTGDRGNGKSTFINKLLYRFDNFRPWIHQCYNREDIMKLLMKEKGICWDDEAVNTGYKRDFQNKGQQELIKVLTNYRDNFNLFASAIPSFFNLDKDLRDLYFMHIYIVRRGMGVVHMPKHSRIFSSDRWDGKYNAKIEENWSKKSLTDPNFIPPYHKLSTFAGYIFFNDVTKPQRQLYKEIKRKKRSKQFEHEEPEAKKDFPTILYEALVNRKLNKEKFDEYCIFNQVDPQIMRMKLNRMLKKNGILDKTPNYYLKEIVVKQKKTSII